MSDATAFISVFVRPDGTWTRAGIYSEFPCEQMEPGAWAMLAMCKGRSFHAARKVAEKYAKQNYPWLKNVSPKMPKALGQMPKAVAQAR